MRSIINCAPQIVSFAVVGLIAAATHYLVALALVEGLQLGVQAGNFGGFWSGFAVSYLGQSIFTFKARPGWRNLIQYLLLAAFNLVISASLLQFLTALLWLDPRFSLLVVIAALPAFSYVISKTMIFKPQL